MVNGWVTYSIDCDSEARPCWCTGITVFSHKMYWFMIKEMRTPQCYSSTFGRNWEGVWCGSLNTQEGCFWQASLIVVLLEKQGKLHYRKNYMVLVSLIVTGFRICVFVSSQLLRVLPGKPARQNTLRSDDKHGLHRSVQPQTVGIPVAEGHRQGAVHSQPQGEEQRHRRTLLQVIHPHSFL